MLANADLSVSALRWRASRSSPDIGGSRILVTPPRPRTLGKDSVTPYSGLNSPASYPTTGFRDRPASQTSAARCRPDRLADRKTAPRRLLINEASGGPLSFASGVAAVLFTIIYFDSLAPADLRCTYAAAG